MSQLYVLRTWNIKSSKQRGIQPLQTQELKLTKIKGKIEKGGCKETEYDELFQMALFSYPPKKILSVLSNLWTHA